MTYEERIEEVANTLTVHTSIDDKMLNDEQLYEVYQAVIAMQAEALIKLCTDAELWYVNGFSIDDYLKQNGYIPEKEEE
jgi:hypothetical protein